MNNNFNLEIKTLENAKNIDNKLMVFAIYFDLYNAIVRCLEKFDEDLANNYGDFLSRTFELCVASTNLTYKSVEIETFINSYIGLLNIHMISKIEPIKELIDYHKDNLEQLTKIMKYVESIDSADIDFQSKAGFIMTIREHINSVFCSIIVGYGEEKSYNLRHGIIDGLIDLIPEMLNQCSEKDSFRKTLKKGTKEIIDRKIENKEFDVFCFEDEGIKSFADSLDKQELQIYILGISHALAGYQDSDPDIEPIDVDVICQKINMSVEEFESKASSLSIKTMAKLKDDAYKKKLGIKPLNGTFN